MSAKNTETTDTETTETKAKKGATPRGHYLLMDPDEITIIGKDTPDGPEHPLYDKRIHRTFTDAEVQNIAFYGVKTPVKARRNGKAVELVDGRGRVMRARIVKQEQIKRGEETIKVPVMIETGDDAHLFGLSRTLNTHKADGPVTNAQNAQKLLAMGKSKAEVALTFGVTEQTVSNWLALLDAAPEVIEAMIKEEINPTSAVALSTLPKVEQKEVLAEIQSEQKETGRKVTTARVQEKAREKAGKGPSKTPKSRIERATNLLIKFQLGDAKTKEDYSNVLERISRVLTDMGLEKLAATDEE